jgi:hypothetical protein
MDLDLFSRNILISKSQYVSKSPVAHFVPASFNKKSLDKESCMDFPHQQA